MAMLRRQNDLQGVPHLRTFAPLWGLEVWDHLNCMPWPLACRVAQELRDFVRGMKEAWQWWLLRVDGLWRYLDELLEATMEFPPVHQAQLEWTPSGPTDESFLRFFLLESYIRIKMMSEAISWPVIHRHLPCWEVLLQQARTPELHG